MKIAIFFKWVLKNVDVSYESDAVNGKVRVTVCFKDQPFLVKEFKL